MELLDNPEWDDDEEFNPEEFDEWDDDSDWWEQDPEDWDE